ncbi:MAG: hypothetical protein R2771_16000 [Saprospiraceae bacterium]
MNHLSSKIFFISLSLIFPIILLFPSCKSTNSVPHTYTTTNNVINFEIDKLANRYIIYENGDIVKYFSDENNKYTCNFSNLGILTSIDVTNPQKILLFYIDFQEIIIVDNTLSEISRIKLHSNMYITAIGMSNDGNIWLYDSISHKIILIDNKNNIIDESQPMDSPFPMHISENKIYERENNLYIFDNKLGIIKYSNILDFDSKYDVINVQHPSFENDKIWYFDNTKNQILSFNFILRESQLIYDLNKINPNPKSAKISGNIIYYLEGNIIKQIEL